MFELRRRKAACPAIEKLHGVYTCFHLSRQILYCEIRNGVDDCSKSGWVSIGHTARKAVILGALSRDHLSGDRPGTARNTQKTALCRDRKRVVKGQSVSVRIELVSGRQLKKN